MLDLKFIRENKDEVIKSLEKKSAVLILIN